MTWSIFTVNLLLALFLLFINGNMGVWKHINSNIFGYSSFQFADITEENFADNFFQLLVHPAIYLAATSWILQLLSYESLVHKLWLVVPLYWLFRITISIFQDTASFLIGASSQSYLYSQFC